MAGVDGVALASVITSGVLGAAGIWFAASNSERERRARKAERQAQEHREFVGKEPKRSRPSPPS
jgi:hypothetical protein